MNKLIEVLRALADHAGAFDKTAGPVIHALVDEFEAMSKAAEPAQPAEVPATVTSQEAKA